MTPSDFDSRYGPDATFADWLHAGCSLGTWTRETLTPVPTPPQFYYRGFGGRLVPLTEPGLWLPLSCALSLVNNVAAKSTDHTNAATSAIDTTGANLIILAVNRFFVGAQTVSDNKGNTYTALTLWPNASPTAENLRMYYVYAPTVGSGHTFSVTSSPGDSCYPSLEVAAFSGASASPFDQQNGTSSITTGTSRQTGGATPSENNELVIAAMMCGTAGRPSAASIDSSFVITSQQAGVTSQCVGGALAYKIQTSAGAENPQWSWSGSSTNLAAIATFKAAAGGASILRQMLQHHA